MAYFHLQDPHQDSVDDDSHNFDELEGDMEEGMLHFVWLRPRGRRAAERTLRTRRRERTNQCG